MWSGGFVSKSRAALRLFAILWLSLRKTHAAGVCCIQSSPHQEHIVCTGSYDERARLWDTRNLNRPMLTAEVRSQDPHVACAAVVVRGPPEHPIYNPY